MPDAAATEPAHRSLGLIFAHPDDETFAVGGTVARYAAQGVRCDLFCATDGDAGKTSGIAVASRAELGALRRAELHEAARVLGIASVVTAGHPDGALGTVDVDAFVGQIVRFVRERRPTVLVTFGPEGAPTAHRDHRAISRAATAAFFLAALDTEYVDQLAAGLAPHRAARLWYVAWDGAHEERGKPPRRSVEPTARIDVRAFATIKRAAFAAHRTQHQHREAFERAVYEEERYALAAGVGQPSASVGDLFAGLGEVASERRDDR